MYPSGNLCKGHPWKCKCWRCFFIWKSCWTPGMCRTKGGPSGPVSPKNVLSHLVHKSWDMRKKTEPQRLYSERDPIWSSYDMGSIPHGDSECFLCSTLVTRRKPSLSIFLPSSKLSIFLIMLKNKALFPQVFFQMCESYV